MLTLALAAALTGFGLLVAALITSNFWVAVACIIVCALGLALLLWDIVRSGRLGSSTEDPPLFTIRDQAPENRAEPLLTDAGGDDDRTAPSIPARSIPARPGQASAEADVSGGGVSGGGFSGGEVAGGDVAGSGLGEIVDIAPAVPADEPLVTGDAHDYIKTITGSFPRPTPPASPTVRPTGPAPRMPAPGLPDPALPDPALLDPRTAAAPPFDYGRSGRSSNPATGPIPAHSPYVGRRRRSGAAESEWSQAAPVPEAPQPNAPQPAPRTGLPPAAAAPGRISAPKPAADLDSDAIVVHDHTGPLPKITIVDPEA